MFPQCPDIYPTSYKYVYHPLYYSNIQICVPSSLIFQCPDLCPILSVPPIIRFVNMCDIVFVIPISRYVSHPLCYSNVQLCFSSSLLLQYPEICTIVSVTLISIYVSHRFCYSNFQKYVPSSLLL